MESTDEMRILGAYTGAWISILLGVNTLIFLIFVEKLPLETWLFPTGVVAIVLILVGLRSFYKLRKSRK